jgi:phosphatidylserine/phosphatidylglycerophosphate/cardiolipin synthase-like enzyme
VTTGTFRVVIPMLLVKGKVHFQRGKKESTIMASLVEAADESGGSVRGITKAVGLPEPVVANLMAAAASHGYLTWDEDGVALTWEARRAVQNGTLESLVGRDEEVRDFEVAVDLTTGLIHDYDWTMSHVKKMAWGGDIKLERSIDPEGVLEILRKTELGPLLVSSSLAEKFRRSYQGERMVVEGVERIDGLEPGGVVEVAVDVSEHRSRELTRLLLRQGTPTSVVDLLIRKKPDLFAAKYRVKEVGEAWKESQAGLLLERVERLWERVQDAQFNRSTTEQRKELAALVLEETTDWKRMWKEEEQSYSDVRLAEFWGGPAFEQGERLSRFLRRVRHRCVILTSFLNRKYADWVAEILSNLPKDTELLILYGHANDEAPDQQSAEADAYRAELRKHLRSDIDLRFGVTNRRTHEKIIVSDSSDCLLGSWNVCSSNPRSDHFEANAELRSYSIAEQLCSVLEEETAGEDLDFIKNLEKGLTKTKGLLGSKIGLRIDDLLYWAQDLAGAEDPIVALWRIWRTQLLGLRDLLWTFFDSPPVTLVKAESLRDAFVEQVRSSNRSLLIATDRVNPVGLDASLLNHLLEKPRLMRIIWGMESPHWDMSDDPVAQEELETAAKTLEIVIRSGGRSVLTSLKPMLNHSKLVIVDEERILVSSTNFLARGAEQTEQSSQEIGLLIESPLLARQALGELMFHSEPIRGPIFFREVVGQPWDLYDLLRRAVNDLDADKQLANPGKPELVSFAVKSMFQEFTNDGKIVGERELKYKPTNPGLSERWEKCMIFLGLGKVATRQDAQLPMYEEFFLQYACEMIGIQRQFVHGKYTIHPRTRQSFVMLRRSMRKPNVKPVVLEGAEAPEGVLRQESESEDERLYNLRIGKEHGGEIV